MYRDYILVLYDQEGTKAIVDEITSNVEFKASKNQKRMKNNQHFGRARPRVPGQHVCLF